MFDYNPNGAGNTSVELDAPEAGTNNIAFNLLRACEPLDRHFVQ
jgi:hypothetical protein